MSDKKLAVLLACFSERNGAGSAEHDGWGLRVGAYLRLLALTASG